MGLSERISFARAIRRIVIEQSYRARVGHIGSALSIADLIAAVFHAQLRSDGPDRDRFVLSKGHAALALYASLNLQGRIDDDTLASFCGEGSLLGVHPEHALDGVDFCTGSLGHGLSVAAGAALAAKRQRSDRRVFVIMSDAELNEGSVWEAAMFAAHHALDNLVLLIDLNGQQALGYTKDVLDLDVVEDKLATFGWATQVIDGHDQLQLGHALDAAIVGQGRPHGLVARTTFGYGVSFMESEIKWHYLPLDNESFATAIAELEASAVSP
jgi:transketolase